MPTVLRVKKVNKEYKISFPAKHPKRKQIEKWLGRLSPGYTEYLLQFGDDPHCSACRDKDCENMGMGDDACRAFKFGLDW